MRAHLEVSGVFRDTPTTMEKNLILRVMQKGLGTESRSSRLARALEVHWLVKMLCGLWE